MTKDELQLIIDGTQWFTLGEGTYNSAIVSAGNLTIDGYESRWVLKQAKHSQNQLSAPARAVRKWKLLNPDYPAFETNTGWLVPYVGKTPASDEQISSKIIEIYHRTDNLVADAMVKNNFLVYNGDVICVDVDQAFRRGSFASEHYGNGTQGYRSLTYNNFLNRFSNPLSTKRAYEKTVNTIKTLIYLETQLLDIDIKSEYITLPIITKLHRFRQAEARISIDTMRMLLEITSIDDPLGEIQDDDIMPKFLQRLHAVYYSKGKPITKNAIIRLLACEKIREMINDGQLAELKVFITNKKELLLNVYEHKYTPLHLAVMKNQSEIVNYLIDESANINAKDDWNKTALDRALKNGSNQIARMLLEAGANVDNFPIEKYTKHPIHIAAQYGLQSQVEKMISMNPALLSAVDDEMRTPSSWAIVGKHQAIIDFIQSKSCLPYVARAPKLRCASEQPFPKKLSGRSGFFESHQSPKKTEVIEARLPFLMITNNIKSE